ncbi:MAG: triose-phosphate isomerase [Clostridia bacterium]|nr:triose-phosphate isomerase [Clostridia bacterium]
MRNKYAMANFKMNKTDAEVEEYLKVLVPAVEGKETKIILGVPFTSLKTAVEKTKKSNIMIAAQNMNENEKGAYTGEVSADMIANLGVDAVIIGHSERRSIYNETDEVVNKKILRALKSGLVCVFCIGETMYERKNQLTEQVLQRQITEGLKSIYANELKNIIIAYEPVWAIGTGVTAMDVEIIETLKVVRNVLASMYDEEIAKEVMVTYGGSVNENNCKEIAKLEGVDGALVGGASLVPEKFLKIVEAFKPKACKSKK